MQDSDKLDGILKECMHIIGQCPNINRGVESALKTDAGF